MCDKRPLPTEDEAKTALDSAITARLRGNPKRTECRYYLCNWCGCYHLTSIPEWPPRGDSDGPEE